MFLCQSWTKREKLEFICNQFLTREEYCPVFRDQSLSIIKKDERINYWIYGMVNGRKAGRETIAALDNEEGITIDRSVSGSDD